PHMLLYHCNFGWPLVDEGSEIIWSGKWTPRESGRQNQIFKEGNDFHTCLPPIDAHLGGGEEAVFIDVDADSAGMCKSGIRNKKLGLDLTLEFRKDQLPWLTNWQHWGKGEYVMGLEPGTNPPIGQKKARETGTLIFINPGEKKEYDLTIRVLNTKETTNSSN